MKIELLGGCSQQELNDSCQINVKTFKNMIDQDLLLTLFHSYKSY